MEEFSDKHGFHDAVPVVYASNRLINKRQQISCFTMTRKVENARYICMQYNYAYTVCVYTQRYLGISYVKLTDAMITAVEQKRMN